MIVIFFAAAGVLRLRGGARAETSVVREQHDDDQGQSPHHGGQLCRTRTQDASAARRLRRSLPGSVSRYTLQRALLARPDGRASPSPPRSGPCRRRPGCGCRRRAAARTVALDPERAARQRRAPVEALGVRARERDRSRWSLPTRVPVGLSNWRDGVAAACRAGRSRSPVLVPFGLHCRSAVTVTTTDVTWIVSVSALRARPGSATTASATEQEDGPPEHRRRGYSHSIVAGGFDVTSSTTRFTAGISFTIRDATSSSRSYGSRAQSAVIASSEVTARITIG